MLSDIKSALLEKLGPVGKMPPFQPHDLLLVLVSLLVAVCKSFSQSQHRRTCSSLFLKGDFVSPGGYWDDPDGAVLPTPQSGPCKVSLPFGFK